MMSRSNLILTTSPRSQPARKPHRTASLAIRQRLLYGRKRNRPTGKERDSETGLYYYGARYLDSKTSRWLSGDPAMGDYVPEAPVSDEARKRNGNLPGEGGVFNYVNLHVYHYAGNNPVRYTDPDGEWLSLKARLDKIGSDINKIIKLQNLNPFVVKEEAFRVVKDEAKSGKFITEAESFARRELYKTEEQISTWAENERIRLDALLTIRDKSESTYERILKEVSEEYKKEHSKFWFDEKGKRITDPRRIKDLADKAANQKLDELIRKELPAYEIQDN